MNKTGEGRKLFRALVRGRMSSRARTLVIQEEASVFLADREPESRLP
jgi:hypothetical protein